MGSFNRRGTAAPSGPAENHSAENNERPRDICLASHSGNQHFAKCNLLDLGQNDGHTSGSGVLSSQHNKLQPQCTEYYCRKQCNTTTTIYLLLPLCNFPHWSIFRDTEQILNSLAFREMLQVGHEKQALYTQFRSSETWGKGRIKAQQLAAMIKHLWFTYPQVPDIAQTCFIKPRAWAPGWLSY